MGVVLSVVECVLIRGESFCHFLWGWGVSFGLFLKEEFVAWGVLFLLGVFLFFGLIFFLCFCAFVYVY